MKIQEPIKEREIVLTEEEKETLIQAWKIVDELRDNMMENENLRVKLCDHNYTGDFDDYELTRLELLVDLAKAKRLFYEAYED